VRPANNTTQDNISISLKANAVQDAANNNNTSTSLGNSGRADGAVVLAIDTQEAAPTVALGEDTGSSNSDGITNKAALTVTVDSQVLTYSAYLVANTLQAGATPLIQWRQIDGDAARQTWQDVAITATTMTIPGVLAEGSHSYEVRVKDALGNFSSSTTSSYTLDTQAPTASPTVIVFSGETIRSNDPAWELASGVITLTGGVETGGKWAVAKDGGTPVLLSGAAGTVYTLVEDMNPHSYQIWGVDLAGNTRQTPIQFSATVNPAMLQNPVVVLPDDPLNASGRTLTNNPQARVRNLIPTLNWSYRVDGGAWMTGSGTSFNFSEGTHSYEVRETNAAGTVVASTAVAKTFTLDTIAPARPVLALLGDNGFSSSDLITNNASLRVSNYEAAARLEWRLKTTPATTTWNLATGSSFDLSSLGSGSYTVEVRQTDAAGNISLTGPVSDFTFNYVAPHPTLNLNGQTSTLSYTGAAAVTLYPSILNDNYTFS
ncbi:MAG: Ig-like domain-containing protein, partial [Rhodoferax sp.]|nr:Ig-like domain-containing protein [Rhodoferax sp.]